MQSEFLTRSHFLKARTGFQLTPSLPRTYFDSSSFSSCLFTSSKGWLPNDTESGFSWWLMAIKTWYEYGVEVSMSMTISIAYAMVGHDIFMLLKTCWRCSRTWTCVWDAFELDTISRLCSVGVAGFYVRMWTGMAWRDSLIFSNPNFSTLPMTRLLTRSAKKPFKT